MSVVPLTLTISLCLAFTFVVFFWREYSRSRFGGTESEALLPLAEEKPQPAKAVALDLGNRVPAQRRRPCGRHSEDGEHRPCHGCQHEQRSCQRHA